jgi:PAS domain S-box-containing protein
MLHEFVEMRREKIKRLALGALILGCAAFFALYGVFALVRGKKGEFVASRLDYLSAVANLKAESIREFHRERISDLLFYSTDPHLMNEYLELLRGGVPAKKHVTSTFTALIHRGLYASVTLADSGGRVVLNVPAGAESIAPSNHPAGPPRLMGLRRGSDGRPALEYEVGTAAGARLLFRIYNLSWLAPLIEHWPGAERTAEAIIFQRDGNSLIALTTPRQPPTAGQPLRIPLVPGSVARRAADGESGPMRGRDYRGELCYSVARLIPEIDWILITKADEKELLAPLNERLHLHVFAACGIACFLAAALLLMFRVHTDRLRAEADAEHRLLSTAIEQAGESIVITDKEGRVIYTNPAFTRTTGYSREEAHGRNPSFLKSGRHDAEFYSAMWKTLIGGGVWTGRFVNRRKNGTLFEEDASITPVRGEDGAVTHYIAVKRDNSPVRALEDQLFHSQKMEAIGRLAGGVAHDFNNILTTINGYSEMLADAAAPDSQTAADLAEILGAGRRAALLTRQLLTFSRRAPADPVVIDLRVIVRTMEKMLRRTLGEDVRLALDLSPEPLWVKTDPGQVDQVIMNLAVNARDAMPHGGTLTVRAHAADLKTDEVRNIEIIPAGRYAVLSVADDGEGMDASVLSRIFEPFFTTKEKGKGTGLGLATVFGIVKQNDSHITVDSAPGRGSTFTIHFPMVSQPAAPAGVPADRLPAPARGDETVLVVEDQAEVLRLVARALTPQGYRVLACRSADEAQEFVRGNKDPIHLLLTDVVMPVMGGAELAASLRAVLPDMRVLYMSGYTDGRLDGLIESGERADLLLKPFTAEQVCRRVRDALDGAAPRVA